MPTLGRVRAGHIAKNFGRAFEHLILSSASRDQYVVLRIPDGCERRSSAFAGGKHRTVLVPVRTPFDFCAFRYGRTILFDAKTIDRGRFVYSALVPHQIASLHVCAPHVVAAGYMVWFRDVDRVIWFNIQRLAGIRRGESVGPDDGQYLGSGGSLSLLPLLIPTAGP